MNFEFKVLYTEIVSYFSFTDVKQKVKEWHLSIIPTSIILDLIRKEMQLYQLHCWQDDITKGILHSTNREMYCLENTKTNAIHVAS